MPTYVLSKVKRTGAGQKVGDIVDQDHPPEALTELAHDDDVLVLDKSEGNVFKRISRANLTSHLNGLIAAAWSRISGKPSTFPPSPHAHAYSAITGKPSTFPPSSHAHAASDISGLGTAARRNTGSTSGRVPLLGPGGLLEDSSIPELPLARISDAGSMASKNFWEGSQTEYNALSTYDDNTIYHITS